MKNQKTTSADIVKKLVEIQSIYDLVAQMIGLMLSLRVKINLTISNDCNEFGSNSVTVLSLINDLDEETTRLNNLSDSLSDMYQVVDPNVTITTGNESGDKSQFTKTIVPKNMTQNAERAAWTFNDWSKNDPQGLAEMQVNDPQKFNALVNQVGKKLVNMGAVRSDQIAYLNVNNGNGAGQSNNNTIAMRVQNAERAAWTFDDWSKNDSRGLAEMQVNDPQRFNALVNQVSKKLINMGAVRSDQVTYLHVNTGNGTGQSNNNTIAMQLHNAERASWTFNDWSKNDARGLAEMQVNNPQMFSALIDKITMELKQQGAIK